jgi:hypothetical protein
VTGESVGVCGRELSGASVGTGFGYVVSFLKAGSS